MSVAIALAGAALVLSGCASAPSIIGVWSPDDGSGIKTVNENGQCSGMYYNGTTPLDIGGGMTCQLGNESSDGTYTLVVLQPPNERTYHVRFDGSDTAILQDSAGNVIVTLTRQ